MKNLLGIFFFLLSFEAIAASIKFPRLIINLRQNTYYGETGRSFTESKNGFGGGLNFAFEGYSPRLIPFLGVYYGTIDNKQSFYDDGNLVTSSFFLQSYTMEPGVYFYPFERNYGFNFFTSAAGIVGYQSIALSKTITFQKLPRSDNGYSAGFRAGLGVDWLFKTMSFSSKKKWALTTEVSYKKESTVLMNQNISLDALMLMIGFSW